jgi:uncharacterized protein
MSVLSSARRGVVRHPVVTFMLISLGAYFVTAAIPPIVNSEVLPFGLPLHGVVGGVLGVGLAAFLVTAALSGRAGVADLVRRSVRWRVSVRWYLIALLTVPVGATLISLAIYGPGALAAPSGGWPRALAEVAAVFVLQLVLFQLAEEIGFTGFLQHHWQDRYNPLKLTLYVALLWAVWHVPDHFAEEGWGMEALISAPVVSLSGSSRCSSLAPCSSGSTTGRGTACYWWPSSMQASMPQSASSPTTWYQGRTRQDS